MRALLFAMCACGRLGFGGGGGSGDGGPGGDGHAHDGADASAALCNHAMPFNAPVSLTALNSGSDDWSARLSPDELTVWFASARAGSSNGVSVYTATRGSLAATFSTPTVIASVEVMGQGNVHPTVTGDGLVLYEQVGVAGNGSTYMATRASTAVNFGAATLVANIDSPQDDIMPFVTPDNTQLWFSSARAGSYRIYAASGAAGTFGTPAIDTSLTVQGTYNDELPVLSSDGLALYFTSSRTDPAFDIHVATRPQPSGAFTSITHLAQLNHAGSLEAPSWLSPDNCRLYFISNFGTTSGDLDLFVASR